MMGAGAMAVVHPLCLGYLIPILSYKNQTFLFFEGVSVSLMCSGFLGIIMTGLCMFIGTPFDEDFKKLIGETE